MAIDEEETSDGIDEDDDLDDEDEIIEGQVVAMRGPFPDGSAEIDVKKTDDGEIVTVKMTGGQVAELLGEEPPKAN